LADDHQRTPVVRDVGGRQCAFDQGLVVAYVTFDISAQGGAESGPVMKAKKTRVPTHKPVVDDDVERVIAAPALERSCV
jgi:hypothetical protein